MRPPVQRAGSALLTAVASFGLGTIGFGLSRSFAISLILYTLIGLVDQISVVMRDTIIQMSTPDELRGRVSAVSQVFINASNQVGAMESGFVAAISSATFAGVSGGAGCLAVAGLVAARLPGLRSYTIAPPRGTGSLSPPQAAATTALSQASAGDNGDCRPACRYLILSPPSASNGGEGAGSHWVRAFSG